jgi:hypothetical protein
VNHPGRSCLLRRHGSVHRSVTPAVTLSHALAN